MREIIENLNQVSAAVFAAFINTAVLSGGAVAVAALAARWKALNAASRYLLWWTALAIVVAAPFASWMLPDRAMAPAAVASPAHILLPAGTAVPQLPVAIPATIPTPHISALAIVLLCWLAAACVQLIRVAYSFLSGLRLKRSGLPAPEAAESIFQEVRQSLGVQRPVVLKISGRIASPAVAGYFRPQVLLPAGLIANLNRVEIEQILTHELAHVKRYDDWGVAAQRFLDALYCFHPLVWMLSRGLNLYREMACDDVVATEHEAGSYAECLAKTAGVFEGIGDAAVLVPLFERKSELLARVETLLDRTRAHMPRISGSRLAAGFAGLLLVGALGLRTPKLFAAQQPPVAPQHPPAVIAAAPPAPAVEPDAPAPPQEAHTGSSPIIITSKDGHTSVFGGSYRSGNGRHEPDTIEFWSNGQLYVIRDPATLSRAQEILKPMEELGRKQASLGDQQGKLGEQQGRLGEQQRTIVERKLDSAQMAQLHEALQKLKSQMDDVKAQTTQELQAKLAGLQAELGEMQARLGSEQGQHGREQSELARQQEALGRQQEALGRQQEALGRQQEAASQRAEKELNDLIRSAQANGLAQPVH